jgi:serine phosphatase RsbU (regulator of sigma subunit)
MPELERSGEGLLGPVARRAATAMLIGVGFAFVTVLARHELWGWRLALYGALCGGAIYGSCQFLEVVLGSRLRHRLLPERLVRVVLFLAGGWIGFLAATIVAQRLRLMPFRLDAHDLRIALLVNGVVAIVIGLLFSSFAALQKRLRESVERIKEQEFAEKELALAREIQSRLLPPETQEGNGYAVCARNVPARFVAGDFYDVFRLSAGTLGIAVADVSGKGIGASLIMASVKAVLAFIAEGRGVAETLTELNRKLSRELAPREFVALAYARFDSGTGALDLANAGLPDPYLLRLDGSVEAISVPGPRLPLGARTNVTYESLAVSIRRGERVLFLTDGLPEALTATGEPLGYELLERLIPRRADTPHHLIDNLFAAVRAATSVTPEDDWTALVLEARS